MSEKITFKVVGDRTIHCNGCENSIKFALNEVPGVREASADRISQMIEVTLSGDLAEPKNVKSKLDWLGYKVESV